MSKEIKTLILFVLAISSILLITINRETSDVIFASVILAAYPIAALCGVIQRFVESRRKA